MPAAQMLADRNDLCDNYTGLAGVVLYWRGIWTTWYAAMTPQAVSDV